MHLITIRDLLYCQVVNWICTKYEQYVNNRKVVFFLLALYKRVRVYYSSDQTDVTVFRWFSNVVKPCGN